jgi:prolipoprotein diacylglyceryl transferase
VTTFLASFPSPSQGVWHLGWVPIRAYALFIIIGIIVALVIGDRRWVARGGEQGVIYDIALWAVPFGLVGGRLYHLITDWRTYFGDDGAGFLAALKIWDGGLGIWGAVALGGVGAWIACRRRGIPLPAFGDAIAPGIVLAQAIGRLGNYFNQELYGRATNVPWGLKIYERRDANGMIDYLNGVSTGHVDKIVQPTFLYELIWNVLVFVFLIYADRRFKLGHGRLFALYVAAYCVGRFWVELLRDDTATHIAGIRINSFTSMFVFIGAVVYIILAPKGREDPATLAGKPREAKEAEPAAVATKEPAAVEKEEVPQKPEAAEDSALVEWTKELAAVAATSGIVAGVAVAAEEEQADESAADGDPEPPDGDAGEPAEEVEEPASAEAGEEGVAEEAEVEAEPAEAAVADEAEEAAEAEPEAEGEEAAEAEEAAAAEAPATEAEGTDAEDEEPRETEPEAAQVEAEEAPAEEEATEPADAGAPDEEGEEAATAEPEAEAEVPTEKVTAESVVGVEQDDEEAAPTEGVVEEREGEVEPAEAEAAPTEEVVEEPEGEVEPAEAEAAPTEEVVEEREGEVEPAEAEAAPTEEVVDEAEAGEDGPGEAAGQPQPETEDGAEVRDAEKGEEAEVAPKADSAAESSEERAEEVDAAEEAAPPPPQDIAAAADAQRRRWSLPRFRNRRT